MSHVCVVLSQMCHEFGVLVKPDYDFHQESEGRVVGERPLIGNSS